MLSKEGHVKWKDTDRRTGKGRRGIQQASQAHRAVTGRPHAADFKRRGPSVRKEVMSR